MVPWVLAIASGVIDLKCETLDMRWYLELPVCGDRENDPSASHASVINEATGFAVMTPHYS